jgi:hypothetical protein
MKNYKKYQSTQEAHPFCTFPTLGDNRNLVFYEQHSGQTQIKKSLYGVSP